MNLHRNVEAGGFLKRRPRPVREVRFDRAEIVDSNGRILVQTGDKPTYAVYDDYWIWGYAVTKEEGPTLAMSHARDGVAGALAAHFRGAPGRANTADAAPAVARSSAAPEAHQ